MNRHTHDQSARLEMRRQSTLTPTADERFAHDLVERTREVDKVAATSALHCGMYAARIASQLGLGSSARRFWVLGVLYYLRDVARIDDRARVRSALQVTSRYTAAIARDILAVAYAFECGVRAACESPDHASPADTFRMMARTPDRHNPMVVGALRRALVLPIPSDGSYCRANVA